ncbi:MAG: hypothetical protein OSJ61_20540, partial [Lachnospiraceae bacterium]|nr:hypothetical protein [Lachnospiraceae bacterium]
GVNNMVSKELTKAAGLENIFKTINKANNIQLAIITVFVEGFNAGMKAAQTSAELENHNAIQNNTELLEKQK